MSKPTIRELLNDVERDCTVAPPHDGREVYDPDKDGNDAHVCCRHILTLAERVEKVLALHKSVTHKLGGPPYCEACTALRPQHLLELYPCATVRFLEGE